MIPNIALDKDKILPLARRYVKDGRIKDPFLLRHFFIFLKQTTEKYIIILTFKKSSMFVL